MRTALFIPLGCLLLSAGCGPEKSASKEEAPPVPAYQGPDFFRKTVGAVAQVRQYQPVLVGGFGLVVGLDGTGSGDVPPQLRKQMVSRVTKGGFGRRALGYEQLTPEQVLSSDDTAVVRVEGVIPPGAPKGTRFDLLVTALRQTETTSLEGGRLYSLELTMGGARLNRTDRRPVAMGGPGPVFTNPFLEEKKNEAVSPPPELRTGRVLYGGVSTKPSRVSLVLRRPNYRRSRRVANRINDRFPKRPKQEDPLAVAKDPARIRLNMPKRFRRRTDHLLGVIKHLYLNPSPRFAQKKAEELLRVLRSEGKKHAEEIALAWEGMNKEILPVLRPLYKADDPRVRLTALKAGAHIEDMLTVDPLSRMAKGGEPPRAEEATKLLGHLLEARPDNHRARAVLRKRLDSKNNLVRIAAFQSLLAVGGRHPAVQRTSFGKHKLVLCVADAERPMIYVAREGVPRITLFDPMLSLRLPIFFSMDEGRFVIRGKAQDKPRKKQRVSVYYQPRGKGKGRTERIVPSVASLVYLMAHEPKKGDETPGFGMRYGKIVRVLYRLTEADDVAAPFRLEPTDLNEEVRRRRERMAQRPETAPEAKTQQSPSKGTKGQPGASGATPKAKRPRPARPARPAEPKG